MPACPPIAGEPPIGGVTFIPAAPVVARVPPTGVPPTAADVPLLPAAVLALLPDVTVVRAGAA
jgi:hypothetical protein